MKLNKSLLIKEVLAVPRILEKVKELKLSKEQIEQALPILIDMSNQNPDKEKYLISFYKTASGAVKRTEILSSVGKEMSFMKNVVNFGNSSINFEDEKEYVKDNERKHLVNAFAKYLTDSEPKKGLFIHGPMGVGKTFTAKRFAKKLAARGKTVGIIAIPELVSVVKSTFGSSERTSLLSNKLKTVEYLFLDDIGAEPITSWFRDEFLFSVLNERMSKGLTTFFTSNYNFDNLAKIESRTVNQRYRDIDKANRLLTRIKSLADPIVLNGINRRY